MTLKPLFAVMLLISSWDALARADLSQFHAYNFQKPEIQEVVSAIGKQTGWDSSHIYVREIETDEKQIIFTSREPKKKACVIAFNNDSLGRWKFDEFLSYFSDKKLAMRFVAAHETSHCHFTKVQAQENLKKIGIEVQNLNTASETMADLFGLWHLKKAGYDILKLTDELRDARPSSSLFGSDAHATRDHLYLVNVNDLGKKVLESGDALIFNDKKKSNRTSSTPPQRGLKITTEKETLPIGKHSKL